MRLIASRWEKISIKNTRGTCSPEQIEHNHTTFSSILLHSLYSFTVFILDPIVRYTVIHANDSMLTFALVSVFGARESAPVIESRVEFRFCFLSPIRVANVLCIIRCDEYGGIINFRSLHALTSFHTSARARARWSPAETRSGYFLILEKACADDTNSTKWRKWNQKQNKRKKKKNYFYFAPCASS